MKMSQKLRLLWDKYEPFVKDVLCPSAGCVLAVVGVWVYIILVYVVRG